MSSFAQPALEKSYRILADSSIDRVACCAQTTSSQLLLAVHAFCAATPLVSDDLSEHLAAIRLRGDHDQKT